MKNKGTWKKVGYVKSKTFKVENSKTLQGTIKLNVILRNFEYNLREIIFWFNI